jgi:molybdopterin molybdotransferase
VPRQTTLSLDEAVLEIHSRCQPLPGVRVRLQEACGRVLRETIFATEDLPPFDCSTRDGFAILQNDAAENFQIVDTIHAADWKPRELKSGETVRIATGAPLPCENLRVIMQENVERRDDKIKIMKRESSLNFRRRGEDKKAGAPLVPAGARLDASKLALLATAGCPQPLVSPRLRVVHFTTGDEIVPPDQTPKPGQIRDSNSILIHGLLQKFSCDLEQLHLPEDFDMAKSKTKNQKSKIENADLVLISGGASVGEKDFTHQLLESLGFEIIFSQVNVRPGSPLIFGVNENRIAFGLPGNPLSHFVCFHLFVATALAKLTGAEPDKFLRGQLREKLNDALCPRDWVWRVCIRWRGRVPAT